MSVKKSFRAVLLAASALLTPIDVAVADEYGIGFAVILNDDNRDILAETLRFVAHKMERGDKLTVFDAAQRRVIAELVIPDQPAYEHPKVRLKQYKKELQAILSMAGAGQGITVTGQPPFDVAKFLEYISTQYRSRDKKEPLSLLLVGSGLNHDPSAPALSFQGGYFPSDGHIRAKREDSPLATAEKRGFLDKVAIHFLHTNAASSWMSDLHLYRVRRFYQGFIENQSGVLPTFVSDPVTAFERFAARETASAYDFSYDATVDKVEMLRVPQQLDVGFSSEHAFIGENVEIVTTPPPESSGRLKVGIRWACEGSDIDLYSRPAPDKDWLYFGNTRSAEGRFFKDWQESPDTVNGFEVIEFFEDVKLSEAEVLVNFYQGKCRQPATVTLRVQFNDPIYEFTYPLTVDHGNKGADRDQVDNSPYWLVINLVEIFGSP
ncbi:MAG: hypothetical protein AAF530_19820 [Pseudomonadota bacterium]